jgi:hypothetical protein
LNYSVRNNENQGKPRIETKGTSKNGPTKLEVNLGKTRETPG